MQCIHPQCISELKPVPFIALTYVGGKQRRVRIRSVSVVVRQLVNPLEGHSEKKNMITGMNSRDSSVENIHFDMLIQIPRKSSLTSCHSKSLCETEHERNGMLCCAFC